jgi:hypothetical protein
MPIKCRNKEVLSLLDNKKSEKNRALAENFANAMLKEVELRRKLLKGKDLTKGK